MNLEGRGGFQGRRKKEEGASSSTGEEQRMDWEAQEVKHWIDQLDE